MSRFRGHVERRIFHAVLLVLAACERPMEPQPVTEPVTERPITSDAAIAVAAVADAPVADAAVADAPVAVIPVDAAVVATDLAGDAKALCANHKKRSRVDRKQARRGQPPMAGTWVENSAFWDAKNRVAVCTIVHARRPGNVVVLHVPHWCPAGGGKRPGAFPREVPGEQILVERVQIRGDGTLAKRDLEWTAFGIVKEVRHNCGRRFEGLELDDPDCDDPGAQLAAMAELEAASVPAFDRLARELETWGGPDELVRRARRAMRDEIRHARVMTALARQHGHAPRPIAVPPLPCRSLEAIAHENAIEGCVREAYGALVATYQAERASPALRPAFSAIAVDERRHAELAEDVHAWILGRLEAAPRNAIERARADAEAHLRASLSTSRPCSELGLPSGPDAVALCDVYFA
jgi:hypothetical protein